MNTRVFGFFTFRLNLFLYTILWVQISMKKIVIVFFQKLFYLHTPSGYEDKTIFEKKTITIFFHANLYP